MGRQVGGGEKEKKKKLFAVIIHDQALAVYNRGGGKADYRGVLLYEPPGESRVHGIIKEENRTPVMCPISLVQEEPDDTVCMHQTK